MATTTKKLYLFGIDSIDTSYNTINKTCCHVTQDIYVGSFTDGEFVQIDADYICGDNSSIEFSIIDGNKTIPILPIKDKIVTNEKIFFNQTTRFNIDETQQYTIKCNGDIVETNLNTAITDNTKNYSISYTPVNAYKYKPSSDTIKIKTVIRMYDSELNTMPYVSAINIRKYGRGTLWTDNT
jgi:hypothetical protein